jgi:hypothetical protein
MWRRALEEIEGGTVTDDAGPVLNEDAAAHRTNR